MIKVFISHRSVDSADAKAIANELRKMNIPYYLDVLDSNTIKNGKQLTNHIKAEINDCTDVIVVMSYTTKYSQWVPFEIGMATEQEMPIATFLKDTTELPEFLSYWPRLKKAEDIRQYVLIRKSTETMYDSFKEIGESKTECFYRRLKSKL